MMPRFEISSRSTGLVFGTYEGETATAALETYARDAGYRSFADLAEALGQSEDEATYDLRVVALGVSLDGLTPEGVAGLIRTHLVGKAALRDERDAALRRLDAALRRLDAVEARGRAAREDADAAHRREAEAQGRATAWREHVARALDVSPSTITPTEAGAKIRALRADLTIAVCREEELRDTAADLREKLARIREATCSE